MFRSFPTARSVCRNLFGEPKDAVPTACVIGMGLVALLAFAEDASLVFLRMPLSNNEGWNAYHAAAAFAGGLYPNPPGMMYNNYPPLSFVVVGALGNLIGDNIFAGRIIALVSTAVAALSIAAAARAMKCGKVEAALCALLFLASPWLLAEYAMYDDPQMLGQALGCAGFALVVRSTDRNGTNAPGALLLTLAAFVKHIFVAQPIALFLWLGFCKPRAALSLALFGGAFAATGLAISNLAFKTDLVGHIASARIFEFSRTMGHPGTWLITEFVPLLAALLNFRYPRDRHARLCAIYAVTAFALGVLFSGGDGVGGNAMFDASIAVALGTGVLVNRLRTGAAAPAWIGRGAVAKIAFACAVPMTAALAANMATARPSAADRAIARADIDFVANRPGPALCEALSLCYWARKTPQVDPFNLTQAFKRRARSEADLLRLLDARYFSTVQLSRRSAFSYSPVWGRAFARNYRLDHVDRFGEFMLPRGAEKPAIMRRAGDRSPGPVAYSPSQGIVTPPMLVAMAPKAASMERSVNPASAYRRTFAHQSNL